MLLSGNSISFKLELFSSISSLSLIILSLLILSLILLILSLNLFSSCSKLLSLLSIFSLELFSSIFSSENKSGLISLSLSFFKLGKFLKTISTFSTVVKSNFNSFKLGIVDNDFANLK